MAHEGGGTLASFVLALFFFAGKKYYWFSHLKGLSVGVAVAMANSIWTTDSYSLTFVLEDKNSGGPSIPLLEVPPDMLSYVLVLGSFEIDLFTFS